MTEQPRDWDKELAEIDRAIARGSAPPGQGGGPVAPRSVPPQPPGATPAAPRTRRGSVAVTWLWVLLALALAVALPLWPYQHACGLQAVFFVGAAGVTALVGGLAALSSWANRRGLAHVVSLLVIAWAAIVAAGEILPRVGYAREAQSWSCDAVPAPAGQPVPSAPGAAGPSGSAAPSAGAPSPAAPSPAAPSPADPSQAGSSSTAPSAAPAPQPGGTSPAPGANVQP